MCELQLPVIERLNLDKLISYNNNNNKNKNKPGIFEEVTKKNFPLRLLLISDKHRVIQWLFAGQTTFIQ